MQRVLSSVTSIKQYIIKYKKIFFSTTLILVPVLLLFVIEAGITGKNAGKANKAVEVTLPGAFAYVQLERSIVNMQKWLYYVGATRNEKGYDSGFTEAEAYYKQARKDILALKAMFKDDPAELQKIDDLAAAIDGYYEIGIEVANAYVDQGTFYGNAMLKVFSAIDSELNELLRKNVKQRTEETMRINVSIKNVLMNTGVIFVVLGILVIVLGVISFNFMVQRVMLRDSHAQLSRAMESLWGEMELARKIQTILLPENPSIKGYDITATMVPADEVGGDYYDIITVDGKDWIVIGDVSGHGVSAGLVMMMVQTSIQTVIRQYPDLSPNKLLNVVNSVIAKNIKRFGESRYMTITVMACVEKGKFVFSGLHQDMMLYRPDKKAVENIETRGMWIGIVDEIEGMCANDSFSMRKGDVLCLFTDGITEAVNDQGEMFGEERLSSIFFESCKSTVDVEEIKDNIIRELKAYHIRDDVTLVLLRRK